MTSEAYLKRSNMPKPSRLARLPILSARLRSSGTQSVLSLSKDAGRSS
jgi:hypothetical protein